MTETELQILDWIQQLRSPALNALATCITRLGDAGILWIALAVLLLWRPGTRRLGVVLSLALIADLVLVNGILKHLFARARPFDVNPDVELLIPKPEDSSFPSGHTAAAFASVAALYLAGARRLWKYALVFAVLMAFTRLYLYVHYPTDILGGIAAGLAAGWIGWRAAGRLMRRGTP